MANEPNANELLIICLQELKTAITHENVIEDTLTEIRKRVGDKMETTTLLGSFAVALQQVVEDIDQMIERIQ